MSTSPAKGPVTTVKAVAELFDESGSGVSDVPVTVLRIVVPRGVSLSTETTNVAVAVSLAASVPTLTVRVLLANVAVPVLVEVLTKEVCAGSGSVSTTLVASSGPELKTERLYVIWPPRATVSSPDLVTTRSACAAAAARAAPGDGARIPTQTSVRSKKRP